MRERQFPSFASIAASLCSMRRRNSIVSASWAVRSAAEAAPASASSAATKYEVTVAIRNERKGDTDDDHDAADPSTPSPAVASKRNGKIRRLATALFVRSCQLTPRRRRGWWESIDATVAEAPDAKSAGV